MITPNLTGLYPTPYSMPVDPYFQDMPCGINDNSVDPDLKDKFVDLQKNLTRIPKNKTYEIIDNYVSNYISLVNNGEDISSDIAIACLFDLVVSTKYANRLITDGGWTYCEGGNFNPGDNLFSNEELPEAWDENIHDPALYFPYLKTCPRCSVRRGKRPTVKSNKPGSDAIGDLSGDTTYQIIEYIMSENMPSAKIGKSTNRQGDVDFVLYNNDIIALGETKSSPLVLYPLEIQLDRTMTEVRDGKRVSKRNHTQATADIECDNINMYIPHANVRIPLGPKESPSWPFDKISSYVNSSANVSFLIESWKELFEVYKDNPYGNQDPRRWALCGCGGGVDDSKNKPGMDRTDDIKKGTYQALKYGAYFKEKSPQRAVRAFIATNLFPLRTFKRYIAEMTEVIWTKEKYSQSIAHLDENHPDTKAFKESDLFNLYDAILGFTKSVYMDDDLEAMTSIERYIDKVTP